MQSTPEQKRWLHERAMLSRRFEAAPLTHFTRCDVTTLLATKTALAGRGVKVSVEDLLIERLVTTLGQHLALNGTVIDRGIHLSSAIHLSVTIALPDNLLVAPAIFNAGDKPLDALRAARLDLANRARSNRLTVTEMTKGTFTISNLGLSRVDHFTPILNAPQIAILGVGRINEQPAKGHDGALIWRSMLGLSLTVNHRAVDETPAAAFLSNLCETIEAG